MFTVIPSPHVPESFPRMYIPDLRKGMTVVFEGYLGLTRRRFIAIIRATRRFLEEKADEFQPSFNRNAEMS